MRKENEKAYKIVITGLMAALCYIAFTFLKIPIPTVGGDFTALHVGNAFCVLAALLLGGGYGGLAGAIGMTIADITNPMYVTSAPKTFFLKLLMGLVTGFVAHRIAHLSEPHDNKYIFKWTLISCVAGMGFNVIMDPIAGYFYNRYIFGIETSAAVILSTWAAGASLINAVVGTVLVVAAYMAIRPLLKKSGLFLKIS